MKIQEIRIELDCGTVNFTDTLDQDLDRRLTVHLFAELWSQFDGLLDELGIDIEDNIRPILWLSK